MSKPDKSMRIYHTYERHPAKFKDIDFLFILSGHCMIRVGQTDKREFFRFPIETESTRLIRPDSQYFNSPVCELVITISQARQLRAAVRSEKASQKGKHYWLSTIFQEADSVPLYIGQLELWCRFSRIKQVRHRLILWLLPTPDQTFQSSTFQLEYFVGWDDRNTAARVRLLSTRFLI
jgi:hypothetical protein